MEIDGKQERLRQLFRRLKGVVTRNCSEIAQAKVTVMLRIGWAVLPVTGISCGGSSLSSKIERLGGDLKATAKKGKS